MSDLLDTPLTASEVKRLPDKLRLRYWAAEISDGVAGLSDLDKSQVRHECRCLLAWLSRLGPGVDARYVGLSTALKGRRCQVEAKSSAGITVALARFGDRFLVDPLDLGPA